MTSSADDDPSLTLAAIAARVGRDLRTVEGWVLRYPDFPPAGQRTARTIGAWLAAHPQVGGPEARPVPPGGPDRRLTLSTYAVETGRGRGSLYHYAHKAKASGWPARGHRHWFPRTGDDGLYRLGDLVDWEVNRPGRGA